MSERAFADSVKDLITWIARALVDQPDAVEVDEFDEDGTTVLELAVAEADLGKVIGKNGRTAKAMRSLLVAAGTKPRQHAVLDIVE